MLAISLYGYVPEVGDSIMEKWIRSNHCGGGECVEVVWRQSRHCDSSACVEVTDQEGVVLMRDSKDPDGPVLQFTKEQWQEFIRFLKE